MINCLITVFQAAAIDPGARQKSRQQVLASFEAFGHRSRLAMDPGTDTPIGGEGKTVEIDETEMGRSRHTRGRPRGQNVKLLSHVERGGPIRSIVLDHRGIGPRLYKHLDKRSRLVSDSAPIYKLTGAAKHDAVDNSQFEWARRRRAYEY